MNKCLLPLFVCLVTGAGNALATTLSRPDADIDCDNCAGWNKVQPPFHVYGNTYYVGVQGLSSVLIKSDKGLILLDGGLPQSAPLIAANIRRLGFKTSEIRYILCSHTHYDHAGGIAYLQKISGATVLSSERGTQALRNGDLTEDDPLYTMMPRQFPAVANTKVVVDEEVIQLGNVSVTAHWTPGHTPGGVSWSWASCEQKQCHWVVYADSLNPISADGFRFSGSEQQPDITASFAASIEKIKNLPCDILITVHPGFSGILEQWQKQRKNHDSKVFIDSNACRDYADDAAERLKKRLEQERTGLSQ